MSGDRTLILPPHLQSAKAATSELVDAFGGQVAAALEVGRSQSRVSAWGSRNTPDFAPLDAIDVLEDRTVGLPGWPHVTRWFARRRGMLLVPRPAARGGLWGGCLQKLTKEFSDVAQRVVAAIGDAETPGIVTADEVRSGRLIEELDELAEQVASMRALAVATLEQGGD